MAAVQAWCLTEESQNIVNSLCCFRLTLNLAASCALLCWGKFVFLSKQTLLYLWAQTFANFNLMTDHIYIACPMVFQQAFVRQQCAGVSQNQHQCKQIQNCQNKIQCQGQKIPIKTALGIVGNQTLQANKILILVFNAVASCHDPRLHFYNTHYAFQCHVCVLTDFTGFSSMTSPCRISKCLNLQISNSYSLLPRGATNLPYCLVLV